MNIDEAKRCFVNYSDKPWRINQREACEFILNSTKKWVIVEAEPGSGKSLISMACGLANGSLTYAVHSKYLQTQVVSDFPEANILWGRANYQCQRNEFLTCGDCSHTKGNPCPHKKKTCYYDEAKELVLNSKLKILNYDYLISEVLYVGQFAGDSMYIIDEADNLESSLIDFTTLSFTPYALRRLGLSEPERKSANSKKGVTPWKDFGNIAKERATELIDNLTAEIDSYGKRNDVSEQQIARIRERTKIIRLAERIDIFLSQVDESWIYENNNGKISFKPLWITEPMANEFLWNIGKKFVLLSASFLPLEIQCRVLGIPSDEVDFLRVPSTFPPERRPIYLNPVANITAKTMQEELPKLCTEINTILSKHPTEKGIIHTNSYKLANDIISTCKNPRLITHSSFDRQEAINDFKASLEPKVFVSPSIERGVSLENELCLHPDTLVKTSLGYKKIKDIKVGDKVFTHKRRYRRVAGVLKRNYNGEIIRIKTYGGKETLLTPEHPILSDKYDNRRKPYFHPILKKWLLRKKPLKTSRCWKNAGDLILGDSVLLPFGERSQYFKPLGVKHITSKRFLSKYNHSQSSSHWNDTESFWELVGLWVAEGSLTTERIIRPGKQGQPRIHYTIVFSFGIHEKNTLAKRCCDLIFNAIGNIRPTPYIYGSRCIVSFKNDAFGVWLKKNIGRGAGNKKIPTRLLKAKNKKHQEAFLAGVCNGDGYLNKKNIIVIGLANEKLTIQLRDLALQLGYTANCSPKYKSGVDKNGNDLFAWKTTISLCDEFAVNCSAGYQRTKIRNIIKEHYTGYVFNLQVEQDESYTTDCLCVHNCEFIIYAKCPYLNLGDKIVSNRVYSGGLGQLWYTSMTAQAIIQGSGRGFRHKNDKCVVYLLDAQIDKLVKKNPTLFPASWKDSIQF